MIAPLEADDRRALRQAAAYLVGFRDGITEHRQPHSAGAHNMTEQQGLTRDQILAVDDMQAELVDVPEWNGGVWVRPMTAADREKIEKSAIGKNGKPDPARAIGQFRARIVAGAAVDEHGDYLFTESDLDGLSGKNGKALERVAEAAMRLSGMSKAEAAEIEGE